MKWILKWKWPILAAWLAAAVLLITLMPSLGMLVREKGQNTIPEGYSSKQASYLLKELADRPEDEKSMSVIIVFNESTGQLNVTQMQEIEQGIQMLEDNKEKLGITSLQSHVNNADAKAQLISGDGSTVLAVASVDLSEQTKEEVRGNFTETLQDIGVDHYFTGPELISEDFVTTTQEGVKKTEGVAVVFIIVVLILIFRSPLTPLVSLFTVALSFLVSLGVVTQLVDKLNFPFSGFTQIFLVLVLFGIGTDYNILLFMRFKEELARRETTRDAVIHTYKTAGITVLYSGLTVFIGFSVLGLAQFQLFKSASAVGIGVGVLLLAMFTLLPIFMGLLGGKLFWPSKAAGGHGENKLFSRITGFAVKRPILGIVITLVIAAPVSLLYSGQLSYNSLDEISDAYPSVKGIRIVYDHFPAGQAMPATLVMQTEESMDSAENLAFVDQVTEQLASVEGVERVYSATRPKGELIPELYTADQSARLEEGIGKANAGIGTIQQGLSDAADQVSAVPLDDLERTGELIEGTAQVQAGINQSVEALGRIADGMDKGTAGAADLQRGLQELNGRMTKLSASAGSLSANLKAISGGYSTLYAQYEQIQQSLHTLEATAGAMNSSIARLEQADAELSQNHDFLTLRKTSATLQDALSQLSSGMTKLNIEFSAANGKLELIGQGMQQLQQGQTLITEGSHKLEAGSASLYKGLSQASEGQNGVVEKMPALSDGLNRIQQGQNQLNEGLHSLSVNLPTLQKGLKDSVDGLQQVSDGLTTTTGYLNEVAQAEAAGTFFIPEEVRTGETFKKSLDTYMSDDRHEVKWSIILKDDPYSTQVMETVTAIQGRFSELAEQSGFAGSVFGVGGISSQNQDLSMVSGGDFTKTVFIMLGSILVFLIIIFRSFWIPASIIASLVMAYFTALTFTEWIFGAFTTHTQLTWTIPFFAFIMIVALGVDYSIFLIRRYLELQDRNPRQAIYEAMQHTGGVILFAVLILSGTFAAMYPSGVLTLVQMATVVIIALFLLAALFLPIFIPACISIREKRE
ncbi:MMPL family transporter [Paenibacillus sp. 19GGS1-52]|uniref:MMPL/RND family transporter n=1 Tax=Paenibacillus sp. 19GGS1-52 TaxID=2758563 RepID=UPI001EFB45F0|nr:MMPL family transporter [Paenibacillus sp. 19GGS1-52]ULO06243.1 MMPL family transporter [Paenibacillus sp. 19GGS1-52]